MTWQEEFINEEGFRQALGKKIESYDRQAVTGMCEKLIAHLRQSADAYNVKEAKQILGALRRKRYFALMQKVADAFVQSGLNAPVIRRNYVQSLLDQSALTAARSLLDQLIRETQDDPSENAEAYGLLGRGYKQVCVDAKNHQLPRNQEYLDLAVQTYHEIYLRDPNRQLWPGINTVALLFLAHRNKVSLKGFPNPEVLGQEIAQAILDRVKEIDAECKAGNREPDVWDLATAAEACLALGRVEESVGWIERYITNQSVDAFEIASTLRQFEEVWELDMSRDAGKLILPRLKAALLDREGGAVEIKPQEIRSHFSNAGKLEKVFGKDSYFSYENYQSGIERCLGIARIGLEEDRGEGTGFLVRGKDFHPSLGEAFYLLTNAHVISDHPRTIPIEDAIVTFQALNGARVMAEAIVWSSPIDQLDATLIKLDPNAQDAFKAIKPYPIAKTLPAVDDNQRIYIIGHPGGGTLSFSMQDNLLLDHDGTRLHYRTPTEGGSSGSPVFNKLWKLIGLHHAGDTQMRKLNGKPGTYEANEGLWIGAIIAELGNFLDLKSSTSP